MTRPATPLDIPVEFAGALPVPFGHASPITPAPRIEAADVPSTRLKQQMNDLVARQREQLAEASAARLRAFLAPTTTPEEGQS
ncbi:hypothetical protein [Streptomyces sp. 351MFTsu5.1]|uniref:hypothetical protein n=1 Tax=Streptomyces sp. 351MFTsu5.1 TaxID=1172180 RepID=UPI00038140E0|nr:hypothetical protein [Streptomyces sp. 351MFTsu5.1]